jgi:DNA-binding response OmpR family regulator
MIELIITANDELYERLADRAQAQGYTPHRAANVLDGFRYAMAKPVQTVVVDMALHAADTLLETLRSRRSTCDIPVYAVNAGARLPFELRRLCTDVLEAGTL